MFKNFRGYLRVTVQKRELIFKNLNWMSSYKIYGNMITRIHLQVNDQYTEACELICFDAPGGWCLCIIFN